MAKKQKQDPKQKQEAQRFLARVPEEYVFYCQDGRILKDMKELGEVLAVMADEPLSITQIQRRKTLATGWRT